jgi:hypothetical protein
MMGVRRFRKAFLCLAIFCLPAWGPPLIAQVALTPAQVALLKRDLQRAEDQYVRQIARIAGVSESAARRALPAKGRITDPVSRVISALERDLGKPLSDEQRAALYSAEGDYETARRRAEANASGK